MPRRSSALFAIVLACVFAAAPVALAQTYEPEDLPPGAVLPFDGEPEVVELTVLEVMDGVTLFKLGLVVIGSVTYEDRATIRERAIVQARQVGASVVILSPDYAQPPPPIEAGPADDDDDDFAAVLQAAERLTRTAIFCAPMPPSRLGIQLAEVTPAEDLPPGHYIMAIRNGSAADSAGLKAGDRILSIAGVVVRAGDAVAELIGQHSGSDLLIVIERDGQHIDVPVQLYMSPSP